MPALILTAVCLYLALVALVAYGGYRLLLTW